MSIVRWGQDGSHVYVYNHDHGIYCSCGGGGYLADTDSKMAKHLRAHQAQGWTIPEWVFDVLSGKEKKLFYINR